MTTTLTQNVNQAPVMPVKRPIAALDAGNRSTQWISPQNIVKTIPSCIKMLEDWEEAQPDSRSILIEVLNNSSDITERFIIGEEAQRQKGVSAFTGNKCEMAKRLVYAALEPLPGTNTVIFDYLRVALPDARNTENVELVKALANTYYFRRNGEIIHASVREVEPVDETRPAYKFAIAKGLYKSLKHVNGVLDLGGGTGIGRLYSPSGNLMRQADVIVPGTFQLAKKIDSALMPATNQSQDLSQVMDAIADGSFQVGVSGANFAHLFEKCRDSWLEEIRATLRTAWGQYFNQVGEILIIGGSAPLANPIEESTKGRFKVAPNSQTITIMGMLL
ncbi:MAG: hypothetical protein KME25_33955 [Symplocastrum torsivum CPER-KK1]|jgi:hypothetical protein|uniref:Actin-like protein N-terminal domain-containing protein n=1 Tax=Symplocastrum torsivum CPER-KK1 TaxID=450513 RepID=A0A951UDX6_9CYAN|nr:hypothetical protein [Symplocastrum torsivum CPER-KK1]